MREEQKFLKEEHMIGVSERSQNDNKRTFYTNEDIQMKIINNNSNGGYD